MHSILLSSIFSLYGLVSFLDYPPSLITLSSGLQFFPRLHSLLYVPFSRIMHSSALSSLLDNALGLWSGLHYHFCWIILCYGYTCSCVIFSFGLSSLLDYTLLDYHLSYITHTCELHSFWITHSPGLHSYGLQSFLHYTLSWFILAPGLFFKLYYSLSWITLTLGSHFLSNYPSTALPSLLAFLLFCIMLSPRLFSLMDALFHGLYSLLDYPVFMVILQPGLPFLDHTLTWIIFSGGLPSFLKYFSPGLITLLDYPFFCISFSPGLPSLLNCFLSWITISSGCTISWIIVSDGLSSLLNYSFPGFSSLKDYPLFWITSVVDYSLSLGLFSLLDSGLFLPSSGSHLLLKNPLSCIAHSTGLSSIYSLFLIILSSGLQPFLDYTCSWVSHSAGLCTLLHYFICWITISFVLSLQNYPVFWIHTVLDFLLFCITLSLGLYSVGLPPLLYYMLLWITLSWITFSPGWASQADYLLFWNSSLSWITWCAELSSLLDYFSFGLASLPDYSLSWLTVSSGYTLYWIIL